MAVNIAEQYDAALLAYLDNADYAETASVSKAKSFVTACTKLLVLMPKQASTREGNTEMSPDEIRKQLEAARSFVTANDTSSSVSGGPAVTRVNFEDFR